MEFLIPVVIVVIAAMYMSSQGLTKSAYDKKIAGVCAGIARHYDLNVTGVRILTAVFALATGGLALVIYICLALILSEK